MERDTQRLFEEQFRTVEAALPADALAAHIALGGLRHGVAELDQHATRDALTSLPNYRALQERDAAQQLHVGQLGEPGSPLERRADAPKPVVGWWVEYLDLDNFKLVNDVLGHPVGNRALRVFATAISMSVREEDEVYRDGGDEFLLFAPVTEQPAVGYSFATGFNGRLQENLQLLRGPQATEYLPSGLVLGAIEHEALDVIGWTLGETYVTGPVVNRFVELEKADALMRERKSGQPRV